MEFTMEISGIGSSLSYIFPGPEKENGKIANTSDVVDVKQPQILSDEEAENVFSETIAMIKSDAAAALGVHSGLSESRVFALLGA